MMNRLRRTTELPLSLRLISSTDCEQAALSFASSSAGTSVLSLEFFFSSTYCMGSRQGVRLAVLAFFSARSRSCASLFFSRRSCSSSALRALLDLRSSRTVPMHSMMRLAYSLLARRRTSSSRSSDRKAQICIIAASSSCFSLAFSSRSWRISRALMSMLMLTWLCILRAETAYWRVESVSSRQSSVGLMQAMRQVRQLPPNDRFRIDVSFESRYGMYCSLLLLFISSSERITFLRKNNDLLIYIASLDSLPTGLKTRSEPARSTKWACLTRWLPSGSVSSMPTTKMEWDREEYSCILLLATTRLRLPTSHSRTISSPLLHSRSVRSYITNSRSAYQRIRRPRSPAVSGESMSVRRSLQSWMKEHLRMVEAERWLKIQTID